MRLIDGIRSLIHRTQIERELDEELRAYLDAAAEEKMSSGMSREGAIRAARAEMGSPAAIKDHVRDVGWESVIETTWRDVQYAARLLGHSPLVTLTAALSLAVGIGATTTIFTIANALLLRAPAAVSAPEGLVDIVGTQNGDFGVFLNSYPDYLEIRQRATTLEGVYGYQFMLESLSLKGTGSSERIFGTYATANYFQVLGILPAAGRLFTTSDSEEPGASPIVVLSHGFWKRRFKGDASIVGQTLQLNGHPFTVVGVAAEDFRGSSVVAADVWLPASMVDVVKRGTAFLTSPGGWLMLGGRLKPGVSMARAASEVDTLGRALESERPRREIVMPDGRRHVPGPTGLRLAASSPIPAALRPIVAGFLSLLFGIVSVVLAIACGNVAGVLLARATARRREIAVRVAIGAGRARLVRQLLTETMLLFVVAGVVGLLLARGMTTLLVSVLPAFPVPVSVSLSLDVRVIVFTTGISMIAALLSGLAPAFHASKADVVTALKDESQGPTDRLQLRNAFVVGQVALSILLVICAGLLVRALDRTRSVDQGFDPRGVELASFDLSLGGYTDVTGRQFARELASRVSEVPGVERATVAQSAPSGAVRGMFFRLTVPGVPPPHGQPYLPAFSNLIDPEYFATMRIPLVSGQTFTDADRSTTQPVAIVPESTARRLWPGQDAVGKTLLLEPNLFAVNRPNGPPPAERVVVGVARDLQYIEGGRDRAPLFVYLPLQQQYVSDITLFARTIDGRRVAGEIQSVVASMDPNLPILISQRLEDETGPVHTQLRVAAAVSGSVGIVGLLLAGIGIYGVTAYAVTRRTREIGVRLAMGAERADIVAMVLRQGLSLVVIGSATGLILAASATRLLGRLLFGLPPLDPVTFGGAALLFVIVGIVACYAPARRATTIDPMNALRYE